MPLSLPKVQTTDRLINQLQNNIISGLKPLTSNAQNQGTIVASVQLKAGSNTVSHGLGYQLTGWTIVRQRSAASIYDQQDANATPQTTLVLVSSASALVDIYCF
jgi:hypothetical protein